MVQNYHTDDSVAMYNELIENTPNSLSYILNFLIQYPDDMLFSIIFPTLVRNIGKFSVLDQKSIADLLLQLYFSRNTPEISCMKLYCSICLLFDYRTENLFEIFLNYFESSIENNILLASYALKYIFKILASQLSDDELLQTFISVFNVIHSHFSSVFDSHTSCIVITNFYKTMIHHFQQSIFLIIQTDFIELSSQFIQHILASQDCISEDLFIKLYYYMFKFLDSSISITNIELMNVMNPFISNILSVSENIFKILPFRSISKYFLQIIQNMIQIIDITEYFTTLVNISLMTLALSEEEISYIDENPSMFYDIAFENNDSYFSERNVSLQFISLLFSMNQNLFLISLGEIDNEAKLRAIAVIAGNGECSSEVKTKIRELIIQLFSENHDILIESNILYLCSQSLWFLDDDLSLEILSNIGNLLDTDSDNELLYLLGCNMIRSSLKTNIYRENTELLNNLLNIILNSSNFGSIISISTISTCFEFYPQVISNFCNEFIAFLIEIINERLEINKELAKVNSNEDISNSKLATNVIRMLMPCISNFYSEIDFSPILDCVSNFCSLDYVESFTEFCHIFNFIARKQLDCEEFVNDLFENFVISEKNSYNIVVESIMSYHLTQLYTNPARFSEMFSNKIVYLCILVDNCKNVFDEYYTPLENCLQLMFIARLIYLKVISDEDLFYFTEKSILAFENEPEYIGKIGTDRVSRHGLFDLIACLIISGFEIDISSIIGKWCQFSLTDEFSTEYEKTIQRCAISKYLQSHNDESLAEGLQLMSLQPIEREEFIIEVQKIQQFQCLVDIQQLQSELA